MSDFDAGESEDAVTPAQRAARSKNAKEHSTGPRTPEGKARSAQNSTRHGVYSKRFRLITQGPLQDDPEEVAGLAEGVVHALNPHNRLEDELINDAIHAFVKRERVRRWESELLDRMAFTLLEDEAVRPPDPVCRTIQEANWCSKLAEEAEVAATVLESLDAERPAALLEILTRQLQDSLPEEAITEGGTDETVPDTVEDWRAAVARLLGAIPESPDELVVVLRDRAADLRDRAEPGLALQRYYAAKQVFASGILDAVGRAESHAYRELNQALTLLYKGRGGGEE